MTKDSQPDNKQARAEKSNYQTPNTRENQNNNKNAKRQSIGQRAFVKILKNSKYQLKTKRKRIKDSQITFYYITK